MSRGDNNPPGLSRILRLSLDAALATKTETHTEAVRVQAKSKAESIDNSMKEGIQNAEKMITEDLKSNDNYSCATGVYKRPAWKRGRGRGRNLGEKSKMLNMPLQKFQLKAVSDGSDKKTVDCSVSDPNVFAERMEHIKTVGEVSTLPIAGSLLASEDHSNEKIMCEKEDKQKATLKKQDTCELPDLVKCQISTETVTDMPKVQKISSDITNIRQSVNSSCALSSHHELSKKTSTKEGAPSPTVTTGSANSSSRGKHHKKKNAQKTLSTSVLPKLGEKVSSSRSLGKKRADQTFQGYDKDDMSQFKTTSDLNEVKTSECPKPLVENHGRTYMDRSSTFSDKVNQNLYEREQSLSRVSKSQTHVSSRQDTNNKMKHKSMRSKFRSDNNSQIEMKNTEECDKVLKVVAQSCERAQENTSTNTISLGEVYRPTGPSCQDDKRVEKNLEGLKLTEQLNDHMTLQVRMNKNKTNTLQQDLKASEVAHCDPSVQRMVSAIYKSYVQYNDTHPEILSIGMETVKDRQSVCSSGGAGTKDKENVNSDFFSANEDVTNISQGSTAQKPKVTLRGDENVSEKDVRHHHEMGKDANSHHHEMGKDANSHHEMGKDAYSHHEMEKDTSSHQMAKDASSHHEVQKYSRSHQDMEKYAISHHETETYIRSQREIEKVAGSCHEMKKDAGSHHEVGKYIRSHHEMETYIRSLHEMEKNAGSHHKVETYIRSHHEMETYIRSHYELKIDARSHREMKKGVRSLYEIEKDVRRHRVIENVHKSHDEMEKHARSHHEMEENSRSHTEIENVDKSHHEMEKHAKSNHEVDEYSSSHHEIENVNKSHHKMEKHARSNNEVDEYSRSHHEIKKDARNHNEIEKDARSHCEMEKDTRNHYRMGNDTKSHFEMKKDTRSHHEIENVDESHNEMEKHALSHHEIEKYCRSHHKMDKYARNHHEMEKNARNHHEMEKDAKNHNEMEKDVRNHHEMEKDDRNHHEMEKDDRNHHEMEKDDKNHNEMDKDAISYCEIETDTKSHYEMEKSTISHHEKDTKSHYDMEKHARIHHEMNAYSRGHNEKEKGTRSHNEMENVARSQDEMENVARNQKEMENVARNQNEMEKDTRSHYEIENVDKSHDEMNKYARIHHEVDEYSRNHHKIESDARNHDEMENDARNHHELESDARNHHEMEKDARNHYEMEKDAINYCEMEMDTKSHHEMEMDTKSHHEMEMDTKSHHEMEMDTKSHREMGKDARNHREMEKDARSHYEINVNGALSGVKPKASKTHKLDSSDLKMENNGTYTENTEYALSASHFTKKSSKSSHSSDVCSRSTSDFSNSPWSEVSNACRADLQYPSVPNKMSPQRGLPDRQNCSNSDSSKYYPSYHTTSSGELNTVTRSHPSDSGIQADPPMESTDKGHQASFVEPFFQTRELSLPAEAVISKTAMDKIDAFLKSCSADIKEHLSQFDQDHSSDHTIRISLIPSLPSDFVQRHSHHHHSNQTKNLRPHCYSSPYLFPPPVSMATPWYWYWGPWMEWYSANMSASISSVPPYSSYYPGIMYPPPSQASRDRDVPGPDYFNPWMYPWMYPYLSPPSYEYKQQDPRRAYTNTFDPTYPWQYYQTEEMAASLNNMNQQVPAPQASPTEIEAGYVGNEESNLSSGNFTESVNSSHANTCYQNDGKSAGNQLKQANVPVTAFKVTKTSAKRHDKLGSSNVKKRHQDACKQSPPSHETKTWSQMTRQSNGHELESPLIKFTEGQIPTQNKRRSDLSPRSSSGASPQTKKMLLQAQQWAGIFVSRSKIYQHKFIDTHCHIDLLYSRMDIQRETAFSTFREEHADTFPHNYEGCVAVFCNPSTFAAQNSENQILKSIAAEDGIWLAVGCHPKNATKFVNSHMTALREVLKHPKVVALGEIGLDYSGTFRDHSEIQKQVFRQQLQLALELKLPIVIHCRDADDDCLEILVQTVPPDYKIHAHCFTRDLTMARRWLNPFPNLFLGFTPVITYKSASEAANTVTHIPLERLLLETDTPYFVPRQAGGEFSHPGYALYTAEKVAELKNIPVDVVLKICRENTRKMYGI